MKYPCWNEVLLVDMRLWKSLDAMKLRAGGACVPRVKVVPEKTEAGAGSSLQRIRSTTHAHGRTMR